MRQCKIRCVSYENSLRTFPTSFSPFFIFYSFSLLLATELLSYHSITQIQQKDHKGSIDILGQNLAEVRKGYKPKNFDSSGNLIDISDCLKKFYDHVRLDIARINYSDKADRDILQKDSISEWKIRVDNISNEAKILKKDNDETEKRLKNSQKE